MSVPFWGGFGVGFVCGVAVLFTVLGVIRLLVKAEEERND